MASDMLFQIVVISVSIEQISHENTRSGNVIGRRVQSDFRGFRRAWGFFFQVSAGAYLIVFRVSGPRVIGIAETEAVGGRKSVFVRAPAVKQGPGAENFWGQVVMGAAGHGLTHMTLDAVKDSFGFFEKPFFIFGQMAVKDVNQTAQHNPLVACP